MASSPSYSPLDNVNQQCNNLIDDTDPLLNPFHHAQDREDWYAEVAAAACEENRKQQEIQKKKIKRKQFKSFKNTSYIVRKEAGHVHRIIKIIIHDVDGRRMEEVNNDPDSASVNIQYLVRSDIDEIMSETEYLVTKIVKKLSTSD